MKILIVLATMFLCSICFAGTELSYTVSSGFDCIELSTDVYTSTRLTLYGRFDEPRSGWWVLNGGGLKLKFYNVIPSTAITSIDDAVINLGGTKE